MLLNPLVDPPQLLVYPQHLRQPSPKILNLQPRHTHTLYRPPLPKRLLADTITTSLPSHLLLHIISDVFLKHGDYFVEAIKLVVG